MARVPRYVLPAQPQHIIQRGNDRQVISASDTDFQCFRDAMVSASDQRDLAIHAHAWMSNHIHLPATPEHEPKHQLSLAIGGTQVCAALQPHLSAHRKPMGRAPPGDGGGQ